MTRRRFCVCILTATALSTFSAPAWADGGAEDFVHKMGGELINLANGGKRGDKALQRRFAALLTRYINIPSVANFALATNRDQLPGGDRAMFYDLVANYAAALFVWFVDDFKGTDLKIIGSDQQGKFITVDSAINGGGLGGEKMRWRLIGGGGSYRIQDLNIKGVWLTIAMKKLFSDTLHASNGDFGALYQKLREAESW